MGGLLEYSLPIKGLGNGVHQFRFHIDASFFRHFEGSPLEAGNVEVILDFDKRSDLYVLEFEIEGVVRTECDRCLAEIDLPIADRQRLLVKFSEENEIEDAEVVYISREAQQLDVSRFIYEFIVLAMPIIKVYDCENDANRQCNEEMLRYLNGEAGQEEEQEGPTEINPIWEELKKLNKDN